MRRSLALCLTLVLLGCRKDETPSPPSAPAKAIASAPSLGPPPYAVEVDNWEGPVGEEGYITVAVHARRGHKINRDYPQRIEWEAPPAGLELPLPRMGLELADLPTDEQLLFTVPAVATAAGRYPVQGSVRLSVCSASTCKTVREPVRATVTAQ
ncbi:MAG: hypothetical protein AAGA56_21515 [Myxococcota bacterium]